MDLITCRTLLDNETFTLDLDDKPKPPCPGANYVCYGYADLIFDSCAGGFLLVPKIVHTSLDRQAYDKGKPDRGTHIMRYATVGYVYGNIDMSERVRNRVFHELKEFVDAKLQELWKSLGNCRFPDRLVDVFLKWDID